MCGIEGDPTKSLSLSDQTVGVIPEVEYHQASGPDQGVTCATKVDLRQAHNAPSLAPQG